MKTLAAVAIAGLLAVSGGAFASDVVFSTSFEASENAGFVLNAELSEVAGAGWSKEDAGSALIAEEGGGAASSQFVRLTNGAIINRDFSGEAQLNSDPNVVWVEGYFRGNGSSTTLADAVYPMDDASAIVHFSATNGIELADGDGTGGRTTVSSGITSLSANDWYRVTIRLDFTEKNWDVWVAGNSQMVSKTALGFVNDSVTRLNGFKNLAQDSADFDAFRVVLPIAGDANGDTIVDTADVVALFENIAGVSDPVIRYNSDLNSDGSLSADDLALLEDIILSK